MREENLGENHFSEKRGLLECQWVKNNNKKKKDKKLKRIYAYGMNLSLFHSKSV
jgi:hypothetical protein